MIWPKLPALQEYPPTIEGSATDRATGAVVPLVARRTGELVDGCEVYSVPIPMPGIWMATGRVVLHFAKLPGRSTFHLDFEGPES